ncbi:MAG TPA: GNAT family N-acetyltransferase, partial [Chloroflexota bacterium]
LRITRNVWDGSDYVPFVWERWLADRNGHLCVATLDDRLLGLQHVQVQPDRTAWLEGIRVDEEVRGRGVGQALLEDGLQWARSVRCPVARLSTSSGNPSSNRIAEKAGLREIARYESLSATVPTHASPPAGVRLGHPSDRRTISDFLDRVQSQGGIDGFYTEGWTAYPLTPSRLSLLLGTHAVMMSEVGEIDALGIATASVGRPYVRVGLLCGTPGGMEKIAAGVLMHANAARLESVRATVDVPNGVLKRLTAYGFTNTGSNMILREMVLEPAACAS